MAEAAQLYVYYRVRPADAPAVTAAVHALHADWQRSMPGLVCTLQRRAGDAAGLWTLMETYTQPGGVAAARQREIERLANEQLAAWIVGDRHVEVFVPCA